MAKKSIQALHFKFYMVKKKGFMEPFPRYHFIIIEIVGLAISSAFHVVVFPQQ
jgi:hypothetical protein